MKVPNIDYSPLVNAQQNRQAASSASFIAPKIETQRQSLALQKKGLSLKGKAITLQDNMNRFQIGIDFAKWMGRTVGHIASAVAGKQGQAAQTMESQQAGDFQSFLAQGFADGSIGYELVNVEGDGARANAGSHTELRLRGADKIQEFQAQQQQAIKDQGWMKEIEDQALSSMQNYYYGMNNRMVQDFYNKESQDRFKLEQLNFGIAKDRDINEWRYTDYRNVDTWIDSLKGYTPEAKEYLRTSAHKEIDLGRAANEVQNIAVNQGQAVAVERANAIADERGYDADTRNRLIGYANHAATQAKNEARTSGVQIMDSAIKDMQASSSTPDFTHVYQQADELKQKNFEQGEAMESGIVARHLSYAMDIYTEKTKDVDTMLPWELDKALQELPSIRPNFEGNPAVMEIYNKIADTYKDKIDEYNALVGEDIKTEQQNQKEQQAIAENQIMLANSCVQEVLGDLENNLISGNDAILRLRGIFDDTTEQVAGKMVDNKKLLDFIVTTNKAMNGINDKYVTTKLFKEEIKAANKIIDDGIVSFFGTDLTEEQQKNVDGITAKAKGSLIDLAMDSGKLSEDDFKARANSIVTLFTTEIYGKLTATPVEDRSEVRKYADAMDITSAYENHPSAVYFQENLNSKDKTGEYVWLSEDFKKSFNNAARHEQNMIDKYYGIKIDYSKPIEYGSITEKRNAEDAEVSGLVPVFTAKDGNKYTVQGGTVYRYWQGRGVYPIEPKAKKETEQIRTYRNQSAYKNQK